MRRRTFVGGVMAAGTSLAATRTVFAQTASEMATPASQGAEMIDTTPRTSYAPVNGLEMYYEIHGTTPEGHPPLVLLHGAFAMTDLWRPMVEALATNRQVIAVDFQGHGRTADIDRPFSYEHFADDIAALIGHLEIPQADIAGYSMGGYTALQIAIRHPNLVRKLVASSSGYRSDGLYPEVIEVAQAISPEAFAGSPPEQVYFQVAPNPDDWPVLFEKMNALEATEFAWPESEIEAIAVPTLLIYADFDNVRLDHAVELFRLLGGGVPGDLTGLPPSQLAIVPGATHVSIVVERGPDLVAIIEPFLAGPMPEAG
jgi:pimeloyl-ACP methyl ester carboxylesterase